MRLGASPEFLVFLRRPDQHVSLFPRTHICVGGSCLPQQIIKFKVTGVVVVVGGGSVGGLGRERALGWRELAVSGGAQWDVEWGGWGGREEPREQRLGERVVPQLSAVTGGSTSPTMS